MARPFGGPHNPRAAACAAAGFLYRWWRLMCCTLFLVCLSVMLNILVLRNQHGHLELLNSSLTTRMATANASSGESPDNPGVDNATCHLGHDRSFGLYKDLLKARDGAKDYFHSEVLMRVQHRLPMENETLYGELQNLKAEALYRFRSQAGNKDITGHVWEELEVDIEKTILNLLHLNLMTAKEKDRQIAAVEVESDCDNITVSEVKVMCLETRMKMLQSQIKEGKNLIDVLEKHSKELEQWKKEERMRQILDMERARRVKGRVTRTYLRLLEIENKQEQERARKEDQHGTFLSLLISIIISSLVHHFAICSLKTDTKAELLNFF